MIFKLERFQILYNTSLCPPTQKYIETYGRKKFDSFQCSWKVHCHRKFLNIQVPYSCVKTVSMFTFSIKKGITGRVLVMSVGLEGICCIAWDRSFVSAQELGSERPCLLCSVLSFQTFTANWSCTGIANGSYWALLLCPFCVALMQKLRVQLLMNKDEGPREKN